MRGLPDYLLLGSSVLLSLVGVSLAWGFRRARAIESFKQVVAAEATLLARLEASHPDAGISVAGNLLLRRVPREPWGWWKRRRRWWLHRRTTGGRVQHFQLVLLSGKVDGTFDVVLIWDSAATRLEVVLKVARPLLGDEAIALENIDDDGSKHLILPIGGHSYLIVEPTVRQRKWRRPHRPSSRRSTDADDRRDPLEPDDGT